MQLLLEMFQTSWSFKPNTLLDYEITVSCFSPLLWHSLLRGGLFSLLTVSLVQFMNGLALTYLDLDLWQIWCCILCWHYVSSWIGSTVFWLGEWIIKRMPFIKHLFSASKQVGAAFSLEQNTATFKRLQLSVILVLVIMHSVLSHQQSSFRYFWDYDVYSLAKIFV